MSSDELRRQGHRMVDWIVDYWDRVETLPVQSRSEPGELRAALPPAAPLHGEPFEDILADLDRLILPGVTHPWRQAFLCSDDSYFCALMSRRRGRWGCGKRAAFSKRGGRVRVRAQPSMPRQTAGRG